MTVQTASRPVRDIPQMEPHFDEVERLRIDAYMRNPGYLTEFRLTTEFEDSVAAYTGARHCIAMSNGTVSLLAIAIALGLKPGDEVIVPNYSMIATANAFSVMGVVLRFAAVERATLCLDLQSVAACLSPATKAIVLVAANGRYPSYPVDDLVALAASANVPLIEDAAQALGSFYPDGTHVGLKGLVGSLSFSSQKIISTGQGGAVITDDDAVAASLRRSKDFGRAGGGNDHHPYFGLNFKFTELQACVGLAQMEKLPARVRKRKHIAALYRDLLEPVRGVELFAHDLQTTTPWFTDCLAEDRDALMVYLAENRIRTRAMYPPMDSQPIYVSSGNQPVSELVDRQGVWLPSHSHLSDEEVSYICTTIAEFYD